MADADDEWCGGGRRRVPRKAAVSVGSSRADVASSRKSQRGWCRKARARATRCCSPGESNSAQFWDSSRLSGEAGAGGRGRGRSERPGPRSGRGRRGRRGRRAGGRWGDRASAAVPSGRKSAGRRMSPAAVGPQAEDRPQQGAFAAAGRTTDEGGLSFFQGQVQVTEQGPPAGQAERQVAEGQRAVLVGYVGLSPAAETGRGRLPQPEHEAGQALNDGTAREQC